MPNLASGARDENDWLTHSNMDVIARFSERVIE
jgi:hypothetical protein